MPSRSKRVSLDIVDPTEGVLRLATVSALRLAAKLGFVVGAHGTSAKVRSLRRDSSYHFEIVGSKREPVMDSTIYWLIGVTVHNGMPTFTGRLRGENQPTRVRPLGAWILVIAKGEHDVRALNAEW